MVFPLLRNSDHVVISASIDFPSNSKEDTSLHCTVCDYSCAGWDVFLLEVMYIPRIVNSRSNSPISMVFSCLCCSHSTVRLVIVTEESWKLPNLLILIKQKSIFSQKLGSSVFCIVTLMTNSVFNKGKSTISPLFNGPDVLPSDKAKLFAKRFFKDSNFNDSGYLLSLLELI